MKNLFYLLSLCLMLFSCEKVVLDDSSPMQKRADISSIRLATYNTFGPWGSGSNSWGVRKYRVKSIAEEYDFDIIGTQEPQKSQIDDLLQLMPQYDFVGKNANGNLLDGVHFDAIFYKKNRFNVVREGQFWLSDTPGVPSYFPEQTYTTNLACTYALFSDNATGKEFYVFNTHFLANHEDIVRIKSAELVRDSICKYSSNYPVFLTGDFNTSAVPNSQNYNPNGYNKLIGNNNTLTADGIITGDGFLTDTYNLTQNKENPNRGTINSLDINYSHNVKFDHIFLNPYARANSNGQPYVSVSSWKNIIKLFPSVSQPGQTTPYYFSSDHNPVMVDLYFNNFTPTEINYEACTKIRISN
ncbi:MAG: endonuclease/exonuclease/phosphatase family protein [Mesonia sp.]|uniref:endonuclease/exonuclease/phosphatase family protein n=1 Tax=Mesonia sp. TaxID=1960830 RepID=UPI003F98F9DA